MTQQTKEQAFLEAYSALVQQYGLMIQPVDQRQQVDGVWLIKAPALQLVAVNQPETLTEINEIAVEAEGEHIGRL